MRITTPAKPLSAINKFVPPPIINIGASPAASMAAMISLSVPTSTNFCAGPPTRKDV